MDGETGVQFLEESVNRVVFADLAHGDGRSNTVKAKVDSSSFLFLVCLAVL